ncbi:MAG TPA: EthD domain-containing protein [Pseudomonadales bacterium]
MLKLLAFICAKQDLSREAFIEHYETHHVPLVRRLLPMIGEYRRNYVDKDASGGSSRNFEYDVVTELLFADRAALDAFWETIRRPEVIAAIREDEARFLQSDKTRLIGVVQYDGK